MLKATWHHCAEGDKRREAVEAAYVRKLIELCQTEEHALKLKAEHDECHHPFTLWHRFNCMALDEATKTLLPTERLKSRFIVTFVPTL